MTAAPRFSLLLLLAATGCSMEAGISKFGDGLIGDSFIEVTPSVLEFGTVVMGSDKVKSFTIKSVGDAPLIVEPITINGSGAFTVFSNGEPGTIAPGDELDVEIVYVPESDFDTATALVKSNDDANGTVEVVLEGGEGAPDLEARPATVDFGNVNLNDSETLFVTLTNVGTGTLEISGINGPDSPFNASGSFPISLGENESEDIEVSFAPTAYGMYESEVSIESNDPGGATVVPLMGMAADVPVAVCSVAPSPVETIWESATFFGSGSFDPNGLTITNYNWTLISQPSGSSVRMPNGTANRSNFTTDVAGTYTAQLIVTNSQGISSEPCVTDLESVPGADFWIEMFWQHSGDDMDMHLVAPGGSLVSNTDCYYGNCTFGGLDWGVRGDTDDNPALDLDDISGVGPENINIRAPANGLYTFYVHDFPGSVFNGRNDVTVNVYLGGLQVWTDTRNVDQEDYYAPFFEIDWPSGVITTL